MKDQLTARIALNRYASDPRPQVRNLVWLIRHQLRAAATSTRDDGYSVEVKRGSGGCWFGSTGRKVKSLGVAEYDMRSGYTSHDQAGVSRADRPETARQAAWEVAMGMRGYAGSMAERETRS